MKAEDKALIMQTLTTLTNSITKQQEEMKALSSANALKTTFKSKAQVHTQSQSTISKKWVFLHACMSDASLFQAQKELLDTELDLYKKLQAGEDIAELKIKYTQLQLEVYFAKRQKALFLSTFLLLLYFL